MLQLVALVVTATVATEAVTTAVAATEVDTLYTTGAIPVMDMGMVDMEAVTAAMGDTISGVDTAVGNGLSNLFLGDV